MAPDAAHERARATINTSTSRALFGRACRVIPGGVSSPVRAMGSVGRDHPVFISRGSGAQVWDADGNRYVDWVQSWGALPFGHAFEPVVEAITRAAREGSSFGAPTEREVELAELVCSAVASVEQVRFTSSGTEAAMSALRVARAATGRDTVLTFAGNYHGHADPFLATGGSGLATLSIPASPGVPEATAQLTLQATWGDLASAEQTAAASGDGGRPLAAIFVEPVAANMGVVAPPPGFLEGLRRLADEIGAVLVFDEVITGFRLGWGGAQQRYAVHADLTCFGKVIGGGLPVGAFGGRGELMRLVAPIGAVYQAGTLSGNPLAMAAGLAQLHALRDGTAYQRLESRGELLEAALQRAVKGSGIAERHAVSRVGPLVTLFHLGDEADGQAPRMFADAQHLDTAAFARTHASAMASGHLLPPSQFEALFPTTVHDDDAIDSLAEGVSVALAAAPIG